MPSNVDVCVLVGRTALPALASIADRRLSYSRRRPAHSTVQNIAIREHERAEWIYKVDEDVLVTEKCLEHMLAGYREVATRASSRPGFAAPILNVNGYSYVPFLERLGLR